MTAIAKMEMRFWQLGRKRTDGIFGILGKPEKRLRLEDKLTNLNISTKRSGSETADLGDI